MKAKTLIGISALGIAISAFSTAGAETAEFEKAVGSYLKEDYKGALSAFQALNKKGVSEDKLHYYQALCYQQLDNDKSAATEYELALSKCKDPAFKEILEERLLRTKRRLGLEKADNSESNASTPAKHAPVKKVIWFSTNWCSHCKRFSKSWDAAKTQFPKELVFEHYNAEAPADYSMVQKYKPKAYPTLVYLDAKNKVIENLADAPKPEEFIAHLKGLGAGRKQAN